MRMMLTALMPLMISAAAHAAHPSMLQPGKYEVQMRLELPHAENTGVSKTASICVGAGATRGLVVLSDNNPLRWCPASNIREDGSAVTFDLVCAGHNQAVAWARFTLRGDHFDGTFAMKMGGKNMTMTERQSGRRTGACPDASRS